MESLLGDEEIWLARIDYRVKMHITFDSTVGSRLNFYTSFRRLFSLGFLCNRYSVISLGFLCNRYSVTRRSGRLDLSKGLKWA
jgi:hypothetical protein